jgi:hypothetical protein
MIVRCVRIINEMTGEPLPPNSWLSVGRTYVVLAVFVADGASPKYRIIGDDAVTPALHAASQFDVVSAALPSIWKAHLVPYKYFELAPLSWTAAGFWEAYFDGDPAAEAAFREAYRALAAEAATEAF